MRNNATTRQMLGAEIWKELRQLNYSSVLIFFQGRPAQGTEENYLHIRSRILCGDFTEAENQIAERVRDLGPDLCILLRAQISAESFRPENLPSLEVAVKNISRQPSVYLAAEAYLGLAFVLHRNSQYQRADGPLQFAQELFLKAHLPNHALICIYNLLIAAHHLNRLEALPALEKDFFDLFTREPHPFGELLWALWQGARSVEKGDFHEAQRFYALAHRSARVLGRRPLRLQILVNLAYCNLKLGNSRGFEQNAQDFAAENLDPHHGLAQSFAQMRALSDRGLIGRGTALRLVQSWRALEGVSLVFLLDLLLENLFRSAHYEEVLRTARLAQAWSEAREQALPVIDLRVYEVLSLRALDRTREAHALARPVLADARRRGGLARIEKLLGAGVEDSFEASVPLVFDEQTFCVGLRERLLDFSRSPQSFRALKILAENSEGLSSAEFFAQVYGVEFHPVRHRARLNSLLARLRAALGPASIHRRQANLRLDARFWLKASAGSERPSARARRSRILAFVQNHPQAAIADLEKQFRCARRTLQLDLKNLVQE